MSDYMPKCPVCCTRVLTDMRNPDMLVKWALRRGEAWDYRSDGTTYWLLCVGGGGAQALVCRFSGTGVRQKQGGVA